MPENIRRQPQHHSRKSISDDGTDDCLWYPPAHDCQTTNFANLQWECSKNMILETKPIQAMAHSMSSCRHGAHVRSESRCQDRPSLCQHWVPESASRTYSKYCKSGLRYPEQEKLLDCLQYVQRSLLEENPPSRESYILEENQGSMTILTRIRIRTGAHGRAINPPTYLSCSRLWQHLTVNLAIWLLRRPKDLLV